MPDSSSHRPPWCSRGGVRHREPFRNDGVGRHVHDEPAAVAEVAPAVRHVAAGHQGDVLRPLPLDGQTVEGAAVFRDQRGDERRTPQWAEAAPGVDCGHAVEERVDEERLPPGADPEIVQVQIPSHVCPAGNVDAIETVVHCPGCQAVFQPPQGKGRPEPQAVSGGTQPHGSVEVAGPQAEPAIRPPSEEDQPAALVRRTRETHLLAGVTVFDGATGAVLADFFGIDDPAFRGGVRVALGDVDGDGLADLAVAAGFGGGPRVALFNGATLRPGVTPVRLADDFFAFESTLRNGAYVTLGDVTGDGTADLILSGSPGGGPRVLVWDAADFLATDGGTRTQRAKFLAADPRLIDGARVVAKDLDGDALADLVVGVPTGLTASVVRTFLGKDLTPTGTPPSFTEETFDFAGVFVG